MDSHLAGAIVLGATGGFVSGLLGVGGGIIFVPALVIFLGEDQHTAQGVSLTVIVATAIAGTYTNYTKRNLNTGAVRWMAPGAVLAGLAGAYVAGLLETTTLRRLFGGLGIAVSIQLGVTALRSIHERRPPRPEPPVLH
jgi:uncharacterized membrane protein YfcA